MQLATLDHTPPPTSIKLYIHMLRTMGISYFPQKPMSKTLFLFKYVLDTSKTYGLMQPELVFSACAIMQPISFK